MKFWIASCLLLCAASIAAGADEGSDDGPYGGPYNGSVELHAHLFMKEGMGWGFRGDFFGPLRAETWEDRFSSQADPDALERSGLAIVVATLYAHPLFTWDLRESIRRQIQLARKFVLSRPDWEIATEPEQAESAIASGKHVLILALEGASGILETEADLREFIDEGGIRIVGPLHLTDDELGGVAFLSGWRALANPIALLTQWFVKRPRGLTPEGRTLVASLLKRKVWIDLTHASDDSMRELIPLIEKSGQPLLYTHAMFRKFYPAERGITPEEIRAIAASGGILGLMPSEDMLTDAPRSAACPTGLYALSLEYREAVKIFSAAEGAARGSASVMMGSDYNGGVRHLSPGCHTGTSLDTEGLWNMGQIPDLWKALGAIGAPIPSPLSKMADRFVSVWKKVRPY